VFLFKRCLMALILCSVGWEESRGVTVCCRGVAGDTEYDIVVISFVMVMSRKLILLSCSVSIVYCMEGDRLCGLVVRVPGYRYRGPGVDSRRYQIF
jgi:hypothetical protein